MSKLTDFEWAEISKGSGLMVETKTGLTGIAYHKDEPVNNKMVVHTEKGKLLCDPATLTLKGFID